MIIHDEDTERDHDRELLDNDPGALMDCNTCGRETMAPTCRIAGDFFGCKHCGQDVHTGQFFDDWLEGKSTSKQQPQIEIITPAQPPSPTAHDFLERAAEHMNDRAATYDAAKGERSMGKTVASFNVLTGHALTEEQGWLFMELLKKARSQQGAYRADNYEDAAAYAALRGECAAKERQPC